MNILILNPPAVNGVKIVREGRCMQRQEMWGTSWAPLTLAIIAAVLRDAGFTVNLKDCSNDGINFEELGRIIREFGPELIVSNSATPSINNDLKITNLAKKIDQKIKTIFFGIHVTAISEAVFNENQDVEFIVNGEPEYTIRDLAIALRDGHEISGVKGLIYKKGNQIIHNPKRPYIENLDELPYPAWDLVNIKGYRLPITNRPFLLVLAERGCPYSCSFCTAGIFYGKKPRIKSWQKIVAEIKYVRKRYNVNDFLFWAENGTINRQHIYDTSQALAKEAPGVRWVCNSRVDIIDEELLRVMKKSGCWLIGYGIESGSQRVLDLMKKNITVKDIENAVRITKKAGIQVIGHVIVGYPGETKKEILSTVKLLNKLDPDYVQVYCCVPFPGSDLYKELKNSGSLDTNDWPMFEQNYSVVNSPDLSAHEIMALREGIIRSFYLNPIKILKTLAKIRSLHELTYLFSFSKRYLKSWTQGQRRTRTTA